MGNLFRPDSPVMRFMSNLGDLMALNLLSVFLLLINPGLFARCAVLWLLVGCAPTAVINAKMLQRFFARLIPEEQTPERPPEREIKIVRRELT